MTSVHQIVISADVSKIEGLYKMVLNFVPDNEDENICKLGWMTKLERELKPYGYKFD
jgi:hypothetical protein